MVRYVDYNVLVDGDRYLKGVIAEKVFERVYKKLFKDFYCCSTLELADVLRRYYNDSSLIKSFADIGTLTFNFMSSLGVVRGMLGLEGVRGFDYLLMS